MYKTWQHLLHLMREYDLNNFYRIMLETRKSLILNHWDGYYTIYIAIQQTSDKCYRLIFSKINVLSPEKQFDSYKGFRELHQISDFLHDIKRGTLPPLDVLYDKQKPKKD